MYAIRSKTTGLFSVRTDDHAHMVFPPKGQYKIENLKDWAKPMAGEYRYSHEKLFSAPLEKARTFTKAGLKNSRVILNHKKYVEIYNVLEGTVHPVEDFI